MFNAKVVDILGKADGVDVTVKADGVDVTVKPAFGGEDVTMTLPMTAADFFGCFNEWQAGKLIQDAFPMLNADQREFLMTGLTPEQWDKIFDE